MAPILAYVEFSAAHQHSHPVARGNGPPDVTDQRDQHELTKNDRHLVVPPSIPIPNLMRPALHIVCGRDFSHYYSRLNLCCGGLSFHICQRPFSCQTKLSIRRMEPMRAAMTSIQRGLTLSSSFMVSGWQTAA